MGRIQLVGPATLFPSGIATNCSPWNSAHVIVTITLGLGLIVVFCFWEVYTPYPIFPAILFANKVLASPVIRILMNREFPF